MLADPGLTGTDGAEAVAWARRAVRSNRRHPSPPPLAWPDLSAVSERGHARFGIGTRPQGMEILHDSTGSFPWREPVIEYHDVIAQC